MMNGNGNGNGRAAAAASSHLISKYSGRAVVAVGAHPDDLSVGIGGTIARLVRAGAQVLMVVVCIPTDLERRKREARESAEILGCELELLYPSECRRVEDLKTYELVGRLDAIVHRRRPGAMISHAQHNVHKDHGLVYHACLATQRIGFHDFFCYFPTGGLPVPVPFVPQAFVDISPTIEEKMRAIEAHATQFAARGLATDAFRMTARETGRLAGVEYAEGLEVVRLMLS
ncbi:MAG: PIG-L family deacetylase [Elusimicrobia bacterium]|nr:PIG-L family deacetylase [Elusimicrobiota bacterium]